MIVARHLGALFCDFDGTILDTEAAEFATISSLFTEHGVELDRSRWTSIIGTSQPSPYFWVGWLEAAVGRPVNHQAIYDEQRRRNQAYVERLAPREGIIELITEAVELGVPRLVVSSSSKSWVLENLERMRLLTLFDAVVTREQAPRAKPFPDLYLHALTKIPRAKSGIDVRSVVALEDSHNGSLAAVRAQIMTVTSTNDMTADMDFSHSHLHVESWADLSIGRLNDLVTPKSA